MGTKKTSLWLPLKALVIRNVKLFMKDKMMVFFSMLAPVIVLLLYILFLGKMQVDNIFTVLKTEEAFKDLLKGVPDLEITSAIQMIINNWMIAGVVSVSCITVAFNASTVMVRDRDRGAIDDVLAAPIPRWVLYLSYILSTFVITSCIVGFVLIFSMIYLAASGGFLMSFVNVLKLLLATFLSILSSSFFMVLIISFIKTESALTSFNSVFSALIGFLVGAYTPVGMLPKPVQYICCFIPGSYSAGLFRKIFMEGPINFFGKRLNISGKEVNQLLNDYKVELKFFDLTVSELAMWLVLIGSIVVFAAVVLILYSNKKTNFFDSRRRRKKAKFSIKAAKGRKK